MDYNSENEWNSCFVLVLKNRNKTKSAVVGEGHREIKLKLADNVERAQELEYLEMIIENTGRQDREISERLPWR